MKHLNVITVMFAFFAATACAKEQAVTRIEGFAIGTVYSVTIRGDEPDGLERKLDSLFAAADASMSIFNGESLLSRLNRNETDRVDEHIEYCVGLAREVSLLSGGLYDITVLPLVEAYGFAAEEQACEINVDSLLSFVGFDKIDIRNGRLIKSRPEVRIDLNSIAKGYIVDLVADLLDGCGVADYLVNVGGEIFCRGANPQGKNWAIGVETPREGSNIQGESIERRLSVTGKGMATSGNYRNFRTGPSGLKLTHIIDPVTGLSTGRRLLSATVIAETCARADALATMFIVLGPESSIQLTARHDDLAALFIYTGDGEKMYTYTSEAIRPYILQE